MRPCHMRVLIFALAMCSADLLWSQSEVLTVVGLDSGNQTIPLPGVTVQWQCGAAEKGVAATDMDGKLVLDGALANCANSCWFRASFVGYETVKTSCEDLSRDGWMVTLSPSTES